MRTDWQTKKLEDICDFHSGLWKGKTQPYVKASVIRNTNFTKDGGLDYSDVASLDVEKNQFLTRALRYGDIILEKSGGGPKQPVGRVAVFDRKSGNFSFSNFTSAIRIKDSKEVDCKYLHKYLFASYISGATETMQRHSTGIRNLKLSEYKQIPVPIPSLHEQKQIVAVLDEAFAAIAKAKENAEKNLANAKELFNSYLKAVFADAGNRWGIKTIDQISENLDSRRVPITKSQRKSGKYPYYGASGIVDYVDGYIFDENLLLVSEDGANLLARATPIAFPVSGKIWVNNHAHILKFSEIETQEYVEFFFASIKLDEYITGAAQPKLNQSALNSIPIPMPPLPDQRVIVAKLNALSSETKRLETIYKNKIAGLDEFKKSILQKAFSGELVGANS